MPFGTLVGSPYQLNFRPPLDSRLDPSLNDHTTLADYPNL